jgi:hypothetical protein
MSTLYDSILGHLVLAPDEKTKHEAPTPDGKGKIVSQRGTTIRFEADSPLITLTIAAPQERHDVLRYFLERNFRLKDFAYTEDSTSQTEIIRRYRDYGLIVEVRGNNSIYASLFLDSVVELLAMLHREVK